MATHRALLDHWPWLMKPWYFSGDWMSVHNSHQRNKFILWTLFDELVVITAMLLKHHSINSAYNSSQQAGKMDQHLDSIMSKVMVSNIDFSITPLRSTTSCKSVSYRNSCGWSWCTTISIGAGALTDSTKEQCLFVGWSSNHKKPRSSKKRVCLFGTIFYSQKLCGGILNIL